MVTPGPWQAISDVIVAAHPEDPNTNIEVAKVAHWWREEVPANARLISEAPELLDRAKESLNWLEALQTERLPKGVKTLLAEFQVRVEDTVREAESVEVVA